MEPSTIAILLTGILNLLATLRQSRCTDIHSDCCYGLCSVGIERDVVETQDESQTISNEISNKV